MNLKILIIKSQLVQLQSNPISLHFGGLGYPSSPITLPKGPNWSLSHLGSPIVCPMTIISTMNTTRSTSIQQIATATIALLLICVASIRCIGVKFNVIFFQTLFFAIEKTFSCMLRHHECFHYTLNPARIKCTQHFSVYLMIHR